MNTNFPVEDSLRTEDMLTDIDNVAIMLKYMALSKNHEISFSTNEDNKLNLIMDANLNILYPMHRYESINGTIVPVEDFYMCMNSEISWNLLVEVSRKLAQSLEWDKIKLQVTSNKIISDKLKGDII